MELFPPNQYADVRSTNESQVRERTTGQEFARRIEMQLRASRNMLDKLRKPECEALRKVLDELLADENWQYSPLQKNCFETLDIKKELASDKECKKLCGKVNHPYLIS
jgi:hypothetical protein